MASVSKLIIPTFILLGALLMLVYITDPKYSYDDGNNGEKKLTQKRSFPPRWQYRTMGENVSIPVCHQNKTAALSPNFTRLSTDIQNFLYYRHCRKFPMILNSPNKCGAPENPADIFLLLVIKSHPRNYGQREVLRKTWAEERTYNGKKISRIFILGTTGSGFEKDRLNKVLALENQHYHDILQWDFEDSFFNLTLKQILFLDWMKTNCPNARFLLNGDDDVFAHTDNMVEYLQSLEDNDGTKHLFIGHLIKNAIPIRANKNKYAIPVEVYRKNRYPSYCGGGGYLLSGFTALVIQNISHEVELLPIDDVYLGMCLANANLKPESHIAVKTLGWFIPSKKADKYDPCYINQHILLHKFSPGEIYYLWHEIHRPDLQCNLIP